MRFGILGQGAAWFPDGTAVVLNRPKVRALLTLLALEPGRVISIDRLLEGMYGEDPPARTANALQAHVSRLRGRLGPGADLVERSGTGYRLAVAPDCVDGYEFEDRVARGRDRLAAGDHGESVRLLAGALELWRGPPLTDVADVAVGTGIDGCAMRFEELRLQAEELRAEADIAGGAFSSAVTRLRSLTAAHPLRENGWRLLVRALADSGRRAEALSAFDTARGLLADELGTDPSPALTAVHLAVLREEHQTEPAPSGRGLPEQLTRLVGREAELERVATMLTDQRVITLTGTGGCGKTRLAIEAARRSELEAHFVEFADIGDPAEVPAAVCSALGLRTWGGSEETVQRLRTALDQRPILLVLDNCEHVASAAAVLSAQLVARCASLRILATSREPLRLTGEALCPIPALDVPAAGVDPARARDYPAVRLFLDRVAAGAPGAEIDPAAGADVITVCRALEGMPLAIELAAARARTLPLPEIVARLRDPFTLLSRGDRTKDARHRTLRSVIEWSWDLLDGPSAIWRAG